MGSLPRSIALAAIALGLLANTHAQSPKTQKTIICFGDSITAGYCLDSSQAYPADLQRLLQTDNVRVLNRGTSGATTKDAVASLPQILALHPTLVIVEFGGNDGLRGLATSATRANLDRILTALTDAHIRVLLVGITLPPNYGQDYVKDFTALFPALARAHHAALMPMIYDGIYTLPGTIQPDGIHPTAKGSQLIAQHMLPLLRPLLDNPR